MITVAIGFFPGKTYSVNLNDGATVGDALTQLKENEDNIDVNGGTLSILGNSVNNDTYIYNNDRIIVTKMVKGNGELTVGKFPGKNEVVNMDDGATVGEAIVAAGITDSEGYEIKMDGVAVTSSDIARGTRIILVKKVKGNDLG